LPPPLLFFCDETRGVPLPPFFLTSVEESGFFFPPTLIIGFSPPCHVGRMGYWEVHPSPLPPHCSFSPPPFGRESSSFPLSPFTTGLNSLSFFFYFPSMDWEKFFSPSKSTPLPLNAGMSLPSLCAALSLSPSFPRKEDFPSPSFPKNLFF